MFHVGRHSVNHGARKVCETESSADYISPRRAGRGSAFGRAMTQARLRVAEETSHFRDGDLRIFFNCSEERQAGQSVTYGPVVAAT